MYMNYGTQLLDVLMELSMEFIKKHTNMIGVEAKIYY